MPEHSLVEIFPEVLGHKAEGTEEGPAKRVEICVPVIWVLTETLANQSYEDKTRKLDLRDSEFIGGVMYMCVYTSRQT